MDADDLALFTDALRGATERHTGAALDAALDEIGWLDALATDRRAAVSTLFELQGRATAMSSAFDHVLVAALGVSPSTSTAVVLPGGLGTAALARSETAVVADGTLVATKELVLAPVGGLDPDLGLVAVAGAVAEPGASWGAAVAAGRIALGHELVGAMRTMLQLARDHAVERIQFGRPIAGFQAVRHKLAEALVAVEAADAALGAAWDEGSATSALVAKAVAGRSARVVARHCQQVLAGIGFTTEHPFHRYLRRALVLDRLLGDARTLTKELGAEILSTRRLPPLVEL